MTNTYSQLALDFKQSKSHSSFKKLYDKLRPALKGYIYNIVKDRDVTEDILAKTFIKVFEKIDGYDGIHSITTWVYTIARRESVRWIRRERNPRISLSYINEMGGDAIESDDDFSISTSKNLFDVAENKEESDYWEEEYELMSKYNSTVEAIKNLRPLYREILMDNLFNKMKYKDIAYKHDESLRKAKTKYDKLVAKSAPKAEIAKAKKVLDASYKKALQRVKNRIRRGKFLVVEEVTNQVAPLD